MIETQKIADLETRIDDLCVRATRYIDAVGACLLAASTPGSEARNQDVVDEYGSALRGLLVAINESADAS